jgi:hypothetical protein
LAQWAGIAMPTLYAGKLPPYSHSLLTSPSS